jgi:tRNA dimethylallyltransferase
LDSAQRHSLSAELDKLSVATLRSWCEHLDPAMAHTGRTQLLRAVETALLSGKRLSEFHASGSEAPARAAAYLLVDPGAALRRRIEDRIDAMLAAGWLEEVRALEQVVPPKAPAWTGTGYQFLRAVVRGEIELQRARELTATATRQYAKRQRTWFRHQLPEASVTRLDPTAPGAERIALSWFEANA